MESVSRSAEPEAFLIAEFESIREMRSAHNTLVAAEISIYVAMVTATLVALAFLNDRFQDGDRFLLFSAGVLTIVALLGWAIFDRVVRSRVQVVKYARYLNRVRRYFVDQSPEITPYVGPKPCDDSPAFGAIGEDHPWFPSGNTGLIAIVNSGVVAAIAGSLAALSLDDQRISAATTLISVIAFLGSATVHQQVQKRQFAREEQQWVSVFPCR